METFSTIIRASSVYSTASQVMFNIKATQWKEKRVRRSLGISIDDAEQSHPQIDSLWESTHEKNAVIISRSIVGLKGLWIKVGQFLSSRPDIMPRPYLAHFRKLQDAMPSNPWSVIESTLKKALGKDFQANYFSRISEVPMSSASIAQVHKATLKTGEEVVIKARHPNVDRLMHSDLKNLETLCNWIAWVNEDYDFRQIVKEWIPAVEEELDLRNEARNLNQIRENMLAAGLKVIVPRIPNEHLVKPDVLVMEYCDGFSVREVSDYDKHKVDKEKLLERICTSWAVQMHIDGIFNADPHPGNILISTDPKQNGGDPSVPVLLDFGLTRRFDEKIKVAFSRLVHSCYVMDVDGLLRSFEEMGLKIREQDPFQDIVNLRTVFQTVNASEAKEVRQQRLKDYKEKQKQSPRVKRPVDAWPGELVFFTRVTGLLKGLCSMMEVNYPYLKTTATVARETVKKSILSDPGSVDLFYSETDGPSGIFQESTKEVIRDLNAKNALLGMQVVAWHKGEVVIDIAAGSIGIADPRPVKPNTLFNVFSVTKGIMSGLLHMAVQRTEGASYDDLVSKYWPGFEANGKDKCTIRHVLNHQAGLAGALPRVATMEEILDWKIVTDFVRDSSPAHEPGEREEYHYITYGYIAGRILEGMTGKSVKQVLDEFVVTPLELKDEMWIGLKEDIPDDRLAVLRRGSLGDSGEGILKSPEMGQGQGPDLRWEKFKGSEHLYNPTTFNMRQVREACIPSANGHMTARSVAKFYSSLLSSDGLFDFGPVMNCLRDPEVERSSKYDMYLSARSGRFALGFQVYSFKRNKDGRIVHAIGHPGLGGSIGMVIPEEEFAIAITTNTISESRRELMSIVLEISRLLDLTPLIPEA